MGARYVFRDEALRVLAAHDPSTPLLLFYAAHVGHFPLQVLKEAFEMDSKHTSTQEPHHHFDLQGCF